MCAILGIALPLIGCGDASADEPDDTAGGPGRADPIGRSVVVVGAGAAGLTAAHLLTRAGVDVKVLEASMTFGGRIRQLDGFVDFPISLGAEWLHAGPDTLDRIVDDRAVDVNIATVGYRSNDTIGYYDGELTIEEVGPSTDLKFVGATWLGLFERFVVPGIVDRLQFDTQVVCIDAAGDRVVVTDQRGATEVADAVIVTVPVTVLRRREIRFVPELPADKWAAIDGVDVWGGFKAFFEFDRAFFPTFLEFPDSDTDAGQRLYYDAAYGQESGAHVLGLFAVGAPAVPYLALGGDPQPSSTRSSPGRRRATTSNTSCRTGAMSRSSTRHTSPTRPTGVWCARWVSLPATGSSSPATPTPTARTGAPSTSRRILRESLSNGCSSASETVSPGASD